ncbi:MAG: class II fructose-bisphosphate aldolase [Anaerolineae bacterium]
MSINAAVMQRARQLGLVVPAFNVPYLPMVQPVIAALQAEDAFGFIATARLEWIKFQARGLAAVMSEYVKFADPRHASIHLDHVPVIDEDQQRVNYRPHFEEALSLGYPSIMVDGSRLSLEENISITREVADMAHRAGAACEGELGAVLGHEAGPLPDYATLFASGKGFTPVADARRFVRETGCDWLSVAIGNVHGAIADGLRDQKKVAAHLKLEHLSELAQATGIPLVLHGGSGVVQEDVLAGIKRGIAKINIGTEIRQAYEAGLNAGGVQKGQETCLERTRWVLHDYLGLSGTAASLLA